MEENKGFGAFFKTNFDAISKLFLNHVAMCVFSMVVILAVQMITEQAKDDSTIKMGVPAYIAGGFAILFYLCLIYVCMWEKGAADKIKIDGGRLKKNYFKGLLFWLVANSINIFILVNVAILSFIPVANNIHGIFSIIAMFCNAMYMPEFSLFGNLNMTSLFLVTLIPGAVVAWLSYISGIKGHKCIFPEPRKEQNRKVR